MEWDMNMISKHLKLFAILKRGVANKAFLQQPIREQAIPFEGGNLASNNETLRAIWNARKGIGLSRGFTSVSELMEDLDADDR